MRLLRTTESEGRFETAEFYDEIPPYAILSHTWAEEEVSFHDMQQGRGMTMKGYAKIRRCCEVAKANGIDWAWADTCCINKLSSAELTEAINSMYGWYQRAEVCYAYLEDVPSMQFANSRWFSRGWTLQELIAPSTVIFFDADWRHLGSLDDLAHEVAQITKIPTGILLKTADLGDISVAQRMSWAAGRKTSRLEDRAYSLFGIFGINMPLIYGEGKKSFIRLQDEIIKGVEDYSIFAWGSDDEASYGGLLASSPDAFAGSGDLVLARYPMFSTRTPWSVSNRGITLELPFMGIGPEGLGLAILNCARAGKPDELCAIYLRDISRTMKQFDRAWCGNLETVHKRNIGPSRFPKRMVCVHHWHFGIKCRTRPSPGNVAALEQVLDLKDGRSQRIEFFTRVFTMVDGNLPAERPNMSLPDEDGFTELGCSADTGDTEKLRSLLVRPEIRANLADITRCTPLGLAASRGHTLAVWLLLCHPKININAINYPTEMGYFTSLYLAAERGHTEVVWLLLSRGDIEPYGDLHWRTPVIQAAREGHLGVLEMYLARDDLATFFDGKEQTLLSHAAECGQEAVVERLLATTDISFDTKSLHPTAWRPQHYAAANGHENIVKMLLDNGFGVDLDDSDRLLEVAAKGHAGVQLSMGKKKFAMGKSDPKFLLPMTGTSRY